MGTSATFGEKDWGEDSASAGGASDFFNMKDDGQYGVRIVGKPHEFAAHWVEANSVRKKVNCAGKDCILCKKGLKPSIRYLIPVIMRKGPGVANAGEVKVTEFGPQVYRAIRALVQTEDWGNPVHYDIMVDKSKKRGPQGTYFVTPTKRVPLRDEEKAAVKEFMERIKLTEFSAPLSNEEILDKLGPDMCHALGLTGFETNNDDFGSFDDEPASGEDDSEYDFG